MCNVCTFLLHLSNKHRVGRTDRVPSLLLFFLLQKPLGFSVEKAAVTLLVYWSMWQTGELSPLAHLDLGKAVPAKAGVPTSP